MRLRILLLGISPLLGWLAAAGCSPAAQEVLETAGEGPRLAGERWSHLQSFGARRWDGRVEGMTTHFHDNGVKAGEGRVSDGQRDGPWMFWYPDGTPRWQGRFERGRARGMERAWYPDGLLRHEGAHDGDLREGPFRSWHDNGQSHEDGTYLRGEPHGELRVYTRDGALDRERSGVYRRGVKTDDLPEPL